MKNSGMIGSRSRGHHRAPHYIRPLLLSLAATGLVYVLVATFIHGKDIQAASEAAEAIAIEQENHAFCANFGLTHAGLDVQCKTVLNAIRRRQQERRDAEIIGLL